MLNKANNNCLYTDYVAILDVNDYYKITILNVMTKIIKLAEIR